MVNTKQDIVESVYAAKRDSYAADAFIQQYMGFIRSETVRVTHIAPEKCDGDELSIAMMAFYEAILGYEKHKGPFLAYAARRIRNRLIDYYRMTKRHKDVVFLHAAAQWGAGIIQ